MSRDLNRKLQEVVKSLFKSSQYCSTDVELSSLTSTYGYNVSLDDLNVLRPIISNMGLINYQKVGFELTDAGKAWAIDLIEREDNLKDPLSETEIITGINELLEMMPFYGEFDVRDLAIHKYNIIEIADDASDKMAQLRGSRIRNAAVQKMIFDGFVINRHDIKSGHVQYRQLTERGRRLKEEGSIEALIKAEAYDKHIEYLRDRRDANAYYIQLFLMFWTGIAALYYVLEILRIQYHIGLPCHLALPK